MNNKSKNLFLGFLFALLILVSITAISAADTNTTGINVEKQDVTIQTAEPVEKTASAQVTKNLGKNDNKIKTTAKENKKEITKNTTTRSLKQEIASGTFTQLKDKIDATIKSGSTTIELGQNYIREKNEDTITLSQTMTIDGQGYTLNANGIGGIFIINAQNIILNNMTLTNSNDSSAVTVQEGASLTENNVNANNNMADYGGVNINYGNLTITNGTLTDNTAEYGGVNANYGNLTINDGTFTNNTAKNDGGVNINYGNLTINDGTFTNNTAIRSGGVNSNENGILTINNGIYNRNAVRIISNGDSNTISSYGGVNYNRGNLTIINGTFTGNNATSIGNGSSYTYCYSYGGVNCNKGNLTIINSTFTNNTAISGSNAGNSRVYSYGGVNCNKGNLIITDSIFTGNTATNSSTAVRQISYGYGGVNYSTDNGTVTINNGNYTCNSATRFGGVNYNDNGNLIINGGTYTNNTARNYGGVNFNNCNITINDGEYTGNSAEYGGVNYNTANLTINNGIYTNNNATGKGSVNSNELGNITIINGTYTGNTAGYGGVNYNFRSNLTVINGTYNNNTADYGAINYNEKSKLITNNGNYTNNNGDYMVYNDKITVFNVYNATFINNTCGSGDLFNVKPDAVSDNTYIGNSLTADTVTITPDVTGIISRNSITVNITITPNDMYNTTINTGNLTVYEEGKPVQTAGVNDNASSIIYTPHQGHYNLTIAYTDFTNSYKTTVNKTITVDIILETKVTINQTTGSKVLKPIIITGTVTDENEQNVEGTVKISAGDEIFTDVVLKDGVFTQEYIPVKIGQCTITVTYGGNTTYGTSNKTQEITVSKLQTIVDMDDITTGINDTTTITVKVKDELNNNLTGGRIILKVNGKTLRDEKGDIVSATVENGTATSDVKFNMKAGTYTLTAVYGGYSYYEASRNKNIKLTVALRKAQLNFKDVKPTVAGDKISFSVKITDNNLQVNGGKINIKINNKSLRDNNGNVVYATVSNGMANIEFTLPDTFQAKTYTLTAVYTSSSYERTENSTQLEITNTLKTVDTGIITKAHTVQSNDSSTEGVITQFEDNTPVTVKI